MKTQRTNLGWCRPSSYSTLTYIILSAPPRAKRKKSQKARNVHECPRRQNQLRFFCLSESIWKLRHTLQRPRGIWILRLSCVCVCVLCCSGCIIYPSIYTTPARWDSLLLLLLSLFGSLWRAPSSCPCHPCAMQNLLRLFVKQPTKTILPDGGDQHNNGKDRWKPQDDDARHN